MTWLLKLYPRAWRRRYGAEIEELVASQPRSLQLFFDLLGGAIDARWEPQAIARRLDSASVPDSGGSDMITRLKSRCAADGPERRETIRLAALMLGGTLLLSVVFVALRRTLGSTPVTEGVTMMLIPGLFLFGIQPLYLRGHSTRAKIVLIGVPLLVLFVIGFLKGLART